MNNIYERLVKKETKLAVIGLGYVGLPIALEFAKKIKVVGFDIRPDRVELMKKGIAGQCKIKASGGIRTWEDAERMIHAGVHRIGASASVGIMKEFLSGTSTSTESTDY